MSGTIIGGKRAAETNKAKYGSDFYATIGRKGGKNGTGGGFAYGDNGKKFGKRGGLLSRRPRIIKPDEPLKKEEMEYSQSTVLLARETKPEHTKLLGSMLVKTNGRKCLPTLELDQQ